MNLSPLSLRKTHNAHWCICDFQVTLLPIRDRPNASENNAVQYESAKIRSETVNFVFIWSFKWYNTAERRPAELCGCHQIVTLVTFLTIDNARQKVCTLSATKIKSLSLRQWLEPVLAFLKTLVPFEVRKKSNTFGCLSQNLLLWKSCDLFSLISCICHIS